MLLYHHVLPEAERQSGPYANSVAVALEQFQEQMAFLKVNGYRTIGADELSAIATGSHVPDGKPVIITFDDGLKSTYVNAYPVLKDHGFEAMVFVITSRVTEERMPYDPATLQFLSWDEIAEMRDVFSIGAHTHALHYRNADGISALLTFREDGVRADLARNRALLFDTRFFAYPFGQVDERAASLVAEAGFSVAFIVEGRSYDWQTNDALHIPRLSVSSSHTLNDFAELLETPP